MTATPTIPPERLDTIANFPPAASALADVNQAFHKAYEQLATELQAELGQERPVIIAIEEYLKLFADGTERSEKYIPDDYHRLKAVCHHAFGVQLMLSSNGEGPLEGFNRSSRRAGPHAHRSCCGTPAGTTTAAGGAGVLKSHSAILPGNDNSGPSVRHRPAGRNREICARGGGPSRQQYFQRLLHDKDGTGGSMEDRVIYAEGCKEISAAFDLLSRHIIDQGSGRIFFKDRHRLQVDILADAAREYLCELLPDD